MTFVAQNGAAVSTGDARTSAAVGATELRTEKATADGHAGWVGHVLFPLVLAVVLCDTFVRGTPWRHEWLWSAVQYNFTTVLLAPAVALTTTLLTVVEARRGRPGRLRSRTRAWWPLCGRVAAAYVFGYLVVVVWLKGAGLPGAPGWAELVAIAPALALLASVTAWSILAGRCRPTAWSALLVAATTMLVLIGSYVLFGSTNPLAVGGATASLVGLRPRLEVQALQVAFFAALTLAALMPPATSDSRRLPRRLRVVAGTAVVGIGVALLVVGSGGRFSRTRDDVTCVQLSAQVCVASGYLSLASDLDHRARPYLLALRAAGVVVPDKLRQGAANSDERVADVAQTLFYVPEPRFAPADLLVALVPRACVVEESASVSSAYAVLYDFLDRSPAAVGTSLGHAARAELQRAAAVLEACGRRRPAL